MAVTPTGPLSLPIYNLQTLLANCSAWQMWLGVSTVAAARARTYMAYVSASSLTRPFAVITQGDSWSYNMIAGGARNHFQEGGSLVLMFEAGVSVAYQAEAAVDDAALEFLNNVGGVIDDMSELAGSGGYLSIQRIMQRDPPERNFPNRSGEGDHFHWMSFNVEWGP